MQTETKAAPERRPTLTTFASANRKAPSRKAATDRAQAPEAAEQPHAVPLPPAKPATATTPTEAPDSDPAAAAEQGAPPATPAESPSQSVHPRAPAAVPATAPAWSSEDETSFQAMLARRKAAGYQRRGKDVAGQVLCLGQIAPNGGTVMAAIVSLVAAKGTVARGDLLDAMAKTAFPHAKARPSDRGWCQGYVAGALRDGFLSEVSEPSPSNDPADSPR